MPDAYTEADKARTKPIRERVIDLMLDGKWHDLDEVARRLGARVATVASKLRDAKAYNAELTYERRRGARPGQHEYRLLLVTPGQLPLFEGDHA